MEGLTVKISEEILILSGRTGRFLKIVNSCSKRQGALLMFDFAPERLSQPKGADLKAVFQMSRRKSAISRGLVLRVGMGLRWYLRAAFLKQNCAHFGSVTLTKASTRNCHKQRQFTCPLVSEQLNARCLLIPSPLSLSSTTLCVQHFMYYSIYSP